MFSKKISSLLLALLLSSCTDFLRGPKHQPESLEIPTGPLICLRKVPENFSKIGQGQAKAADVDTDFKCLENALIYFKDRTVGTYKDGYTAEDFRQFFGKYFLTKNNISKNFADELVLLKSAVIGGKPNIVSKEEVAKLSHFIGVLRQELIPLLPSIEILTRKAKTADQKQIDAAILALKTVGRALLQESLLYKSDYTFDDLHSLVIETGAFLGIQGHNQINADFEKYWPLLESLKKVLLGQRASLRSLPDWLGALNSFADLYDLILRKHYFLHSFEFNSVSELNKIGDALDKILNLLSTSHQLKNYNFIPCEQIDEVIDRLYQVGIMTLNLSPSTLKETYRTILGRMTLGSQFQSAHEVINVTQDHIHYLRREVHIWRSLQTWINTLTYDVATPILWNQVTGSLNRYIARNLVKNLNLLQNNNVSGLQKEELQKAMNEFRELLNHQRPVKFSLQGRIVLRYDTTDRGVSWTSLSLSNMTYIFTRLMLRGYSEFSPTSKKIIISEREFVRWYDDFKNLGLEIKAFDPRQANSGKRSAKEANFFMFSSNGDKEIDANELYEYIAMMVAAGLRSVDSARQVAALENCLEMGTKDVFGLPFIKENEFKKAITKHRAELFNNLPYLIGYFQKYPERWNSFYDDLLDAARVSDPQGGRLEHGDLRVFVMMIHYQESLLLAYDRNRDGFLSVPETEMAVPRFLGFLKEITTEIPWFLKSVDGWLLKHGFVYLVMKGERPAGPDWIQYAWQRLTDPFSEQQTRADRVSVAQVFRNLKDELKKP